YQTLTACLVLSFLIFLIPPPPRSALFPYTTLFRSTEPVLARILSARGLDGILRKLRRAEEEMGDMSLTEARREKAMNRYPRLEAELDAAGGYAAEAEAKRMAANLGLPNRLLEQELGTLSGGQRRRVELARILFSQASTMILDEPTNHLDHDSIV